MKTPRLTRFSVSMPADLVRDLDAMLREKGYGNRSQAVADMARTALVEHRQHRDNEEIAGTITLVYNHHKPHLQAALTDVQHDHHHLIVSTLHVHLDHDHCLEALVVRGKAREVKAIADELLSCKGLRHGRLTVTATGHDMKPSREEHHAHG